MVSACRRLLSSISLITALRIWWGGLSLQLCLTLWPRPTRCSHCLPPPRLLPSSCSLSLLRSLRSLPEEPQTINPLLHLTSSRVSLSPSIPPSLRLLLTCCFSSLPLLTLELFGFCLRSVTHLSWVFGDLFAGLERTVEQRQHTHTWSGHR